jgi:hypothetical protein
MAKTAADAAKLTNQAEGKHHIGDFLPPEELSKFMDKYKVTSYRILHVHLSLLKGLFLYANSCQLSVFSRVMDSDWIRIQLLLCIRIRIWNSDPGAIK